MRQAEELSTTTQPASRAMGAYSLETAPPAEKRAMSTPLKRSGDSSRHSTSSPLKASLFPAERSEANGTSSCRGKSRSSSMLNISRPTAPVAPTTATLHFLVNFFLLCPLSGQRRKKLTRKCRVAVVGATGAVGREMLSILEERDFPLQELVPLASERSAGKRLAFRGEEVECLELSPDRLRGVDIALFSAGGAVSKEYAPIARDAGCVVVSTYQAVSGSGVKAVRELQEQSEAVLGGRSPQARVYPHQIAFNCLPHIDLFLDDGSTKEERKMVQETKKIMGDQRLAVTATCVRVPVKTCHSEAVNVEFHSELSPERARDILAAAPGVQVIDDPLRNEYPLPVAAASMSRARSGLSSEWNSTLTASEWQVCTGTRTQAVSYTHLRAHETDS